MDWLLFVALIVGGVGLALWLRASKIRRETALPRGRVVYTDTGNWNRCIRPLFSDRYRLTGKPDYLVRRPEGMIPVEVKSGQAPALPHWAHVLQLAAYCLLVEDQEARRPPYGIVKYEDRAFEVDYTLALQAELLTTLAAMRRHLYAHDVDRNHREPARCQGCGYRERCERQLD